MEEIYLILTNRFCLRQEAANTQKKKTKAKEEIAVEAGSDLCGQIRKQLVH